MPRLTINSKEVEMEVKPVEVTWARAFKLWWYVTWRATMATVGAVVMLSLFLALLRAILKPLPRFMYGYPFLFLLRLIVWIILALFGIFVTKQAFKKQFSDFKITMAEK